MIGYHLVMTSGQRYQGAGGSLPKVGEVVAGFIVRKVTGRDVYLDMPQTQAEWKAFTDWERRRRERRIDGEKRGPRKRSPRKVQP